MSLNLSFSEFGLRIVHFDHLSEPFQLLDAGGDSSERVEQRHDLVPGQGQVRLRVREEDLEGRAQPRRLQLAPQLALLAADAVHDAADVAEVIAKFEFQL